MNTQTLVASAQQGEWLAGPLLVSRYLPRMLTYGRILAPDASEPDVEHICERAIERAVRRVDRYRPERGSFAAWLRGFLRHEVLEWRRTGHATVPLPDSIAVPDPPDDEELSIEIRDSLARAVGQLKETDQLIIGLRDVEQVPYEHIASRLAVNVEACRQRHLRALSRLRRIAETDPILRDRYLREVDDER